LQRSFGRRKRDFPQGRLADREVQAFAHLGADFDRPVGGDPQNMVEDRKSVV
jgi:hypothetical protein